MSLSSAQLQQGYMVGALFPTKQAVAYIGAAYTAVSAGVAEVANLNILTEASPLLIIENTAGSGGPSIVLDYVRIGATAIAATSTDWQYSWKMDSIRGKWASGGSALTPQNAHMGFANSSVASVHFGALAVLLAQRSSNNARTIAAGFLAPTATAPAVVLGDVANFRFGAEEAAESHTSNDTASAGAHLHPLAYNVGIHTVVLPPGSTATLFMFNTTNTTQTPSYELNMGWFEF